MELIDVGPTLAEATGAPIQYARWGRSLLPFLHKEGSAPTRDIAVSEQRGEIMAVGARWKVVLNQAGEAYLCTDLEQDPDELRNLAGTPEAREVEQQHRELLLAFLLRTQLFDDWRSAT